MFADLNDGGRKNNLHPEDRKVLEELTQPRKWDSKRFKEILISLGTLGSHASIPGPNRPDEINTDGFAPIVDQLIGITKQNKIEVSRPLFVDTRNQKLIFSKDITKGSMGGVDLIWSPPDPIRYKDFKRIGIFHTHPTHNFSRVTAHAFSDVDFVPFLADNQPQISMIGYGEGEKLMLMKTSVTPRDLNKEKVASDANSLLKEFFNGKARSMAEAMTSMIQMNKIACVEFGMTLYHAKSGYDFKRVKVVD